MSWDAGTRWGGYDAARETMMIHTDGTTVPLKDPITGLTSQARFSIPVPNPWPRTLTTRRHRVTRQESSECGCVGSHADEVLIELVVIAVVRSPRVTEWTGR
jgi:hypothetical protein